MLASTAFAAAHKDESYSSPLQRGMLRDCFALGSLHPLGKLSASFLFCGNIMLGSSLDPSNGCAVGFAPGK